MIDKKKILGVNVEDSGKDWIKFKTVESARKYYNLLMSLQSKYSTTGYSIKGRTVIRW